MKCFVTGASGFVGANLVHELLGQGHRVSVLVRSGSDLAGLGAADCEIVIGSLSEPESYRAALSGSEWCFHVAASYHLWLSDYRPMYAANVEGTRLLLQTAIDAGCQRIVYTSTVGCIGLPTSVNGHFEPTDESALIVESQLTNHYKRSKWQAEVVARQFAEAGHPIVIVNPSTPIGPRDVKPTPTGKVIVDFLNRDLPGYIDTGLNWVHVRDVVKGHVLAAEKGRIGERYILGHAEGNLSMLDALKVLESISELPAPKLRVPYSVAWTAAVVSEGIAKLTKKSPKAPLAGVRMAKYKMWFNPSKAINELGMPQTPVREAFEDAVGWFRENGYVGSI
jgi:dihydroflavonol-4-reductase